MRIALLVAALTLTSHPASGLDVVPHGSLENYKATCAAAGERLWGRSLCAPVVLVDATTGKYVASQATPGPLPPTRANTSFDWMGTTWLMLLQPLPSDPAERASLFFHESFHVHQRELGLPQSGRVAGHLANWQGRVAIRLEWKALARALTSSGATREAHVREALAYRARRLAGDSTAAEDERALMRHEGLASYTGVVLSGDPLRLALLELQRGPERPSLARSFAYSSAPAWGLLLDAMRPQWRDALQGGQDLPDLIPLPIYPTTPIAKLDETKIVADERARARSEAQLLKFAMASTAETSGLRLPLSAMNMDFDPNRVGSTPDGSTIYWKITLRDTWGSLVVDGSPLRMSKDFTAAFVAWPLPADVKLTLNAGWSIGRGGAARELRKNNKTSRD